MNSRNIFVRFVPANAVDYCDQLYQKLAFELKIKKARQTKLGDYRYDPETGKHTISINNDLNPYAFLITYLHEIAHLITHVEHIGQSLLPHGAEWKECFSKIARPVLNDEVFSVAVLKTLEKYFKNPKASSCSDPNLYQVLRLYDNHGDKILLKEIQHGESFIFRSKSFIKGIKKRTRCVCEEISTKRKYLIPELTEVTQKN